MSKKFIKLKKKFTLDYELLKKRKKVQFCKKCVISNQRPRIIFDENGICSACNYVEEKKKIDWDKRERELQNLCNKFRSRNGNYDVIVPGSGGKDSAYVAHVLKHKYNMHPLCVTWAPFEYTSIGWKNFKDFKDSGFDNLSFFHDGLIHRKLSLMGFDLVADNFLPFVHGQKAYAFHLSIKFKIPLMFYGECGPVEYGGSIKAKNKPYESIEDWDSNYHKGVNIDKLLKYAVDYGYLTKKEVNNRSLDFYRAPKINDINRVGCQMHWMSYYKKWVPQENYYYAAKYTGFVPKSGRSEGTYSRYASLDDSTDGVHWLMGYIKFGLGRASSDAAHEIRDGHLLREEGVSLVEQFDNELPERDIKNFLKYVNISRKHFNEVIDFYREMSPNIWKKVGGKWKIRHTVGGNGCDDSSWPKNQ